MFQLKDSIHCKKNKKLSIAYYLWQGVFDESDAFFTSTFWSCVEKDQIEMMEYIGKTQLDTLKWSRLHIISYGIHPKLISMAYIKNVTVSQKHINTLEKFFIKHFSDLIKFSDDGNLPIHLACQTNNLFILKIILSIANEKLSQQQFHEMLNQAKKDKYWKYTPLMIAIKNNCIDCVKLLCEYECVVDGIVKYKSRYPSYNSFEFACYYNNIDILKIFCNVCDLKQLNLSSKEYISHLKKLVNDGSSKGYIGSKCVEFLDELFSNPIAVLKLKESQSATKKADTVLNHKQMKKFDYVCCWNHLLPRKMWFADEKCDICQQSNTKCWKCEECASQGDSNLLPSIICEKCVIATSLWSAIVHTTQNTIFIDELEHMASNLINTDTVNRVKCALYRLVYVMS